MPLLNLNDQNNIAQVPSNFQTLDTSRYVVFPYSQAYSYYLSDGKPTTISPSEINLIDTLLIKASEEYNNKKDKYFSWQPISSLESYKLQLIAVLDSNNKKMVYANCFSPWTLYGRKETLKDQPSDWRTVLVLADGGGNTFFHLTFNLTDSTYNPIITNSHL